MLTQGLDSRQIEPRPSTLLLGREYQLLFLSPFPGSNAYILLPNQSPYRARPAEPGTSIYVDNLWISSELVDVYSIN